MPKVRSLDPIQFKKHRLIDFLWGEADRLNITQKQMAYELDLSESNMSRRRKSENYSVEDLLKMIEVTHIDAETLGRLIT